MNVFDPPERRALAYELVWGKSAVTRTDIERRLVGALEQIAAQWKEILGNKKGE